MVRCNPRNSNGTYVDDLNFTSEDRADILKTIRFLREHEHDFKLSLSEAKTEVSASPPEHTRELPLGTKSLHSKFGELLKCM